MNLTSEQVLALAPDASAVKAARSVARPASWKSAGRSPDALWGECQGSALYQVRIDLGDLASKCSCPSRKFPCKHALGLLLLATSTSIAEATPPQWIDEWLAQRRKRSQDALTPAKYAPTAPKEIDLEAQAARVQQRVSRVAKGVEALDLWMNDLVRNGLGGLETRPLSFFESQAARLVDAQAAGLASRVRRLASLVGGDGDWPHRFLDELGRLALLTQAIGRLSSLPVPLQDDVRQMIGWTLTQEDVAARGERVTDEWIVGGQVHGDDERVRMQRNWLFGAKTKRVALLLQFAVGTASFPHTMVAGSRFASELVYWPSASPLRAMIGVGGEELPVADNRAWNAFETIEAVLSRMADLLAHQPFLDRVGVALSGVCPVRTADRWQIRDTTGRALSVAGDAPWKLVALSGGHPIDVFGEWNFAELRPLGAIVEGRFHALAEHAE